MNILRQYSLPNCILTLEGFDDGTGNFTQTLSVLTNVECHFVTSKQVLNGGKVFFDHLVRSVSEYVQGVLSGMHHPIDALDPDGQVTITTLTPSNVHQLIWQQEGGDTVQNEVHLTTAELFDLTEAIDQFLADAFTLPNFVLPLTPLSRRHAIPEQSFAERAVPSVVGISGFALTAFALFFVPVPENVRTAKDLTNPDKTEQTTPEKVSTAAEVSAKDLEDLVQTVPEVKDDLSLEMMQTYLYRTLDGAWVNRVEGQKAAYRLSLARDGSIVGYQPIDGTTAEAVSSTPLTALSYTPVDQAIATSESVGQFKVVFNGKTLEVSPWNGFRGDLSFDTSQLRGEDLRKLVLNVRQTIIKELGTGMVDTNKPLKYNIGVTDDGAIAFYRSDNSLAETSVEQTPLPKLIQPETAGIVAEESIIPQKPLTQVKVVFQPNGVVEVSPWAGYR